MEKQYLHRVFRYMSRPHTKTEIPITFVTLKLLRISQERYTKLYFRIRVILVYMELRFHDICRLVNWPIYNVLYLEITYVSKPWKLYMYTMYGKHDKSAINGTHELVFKICNIIKSETELHSKMIPTPYLSLRVCSSHESNKTHKCENPLM